MIRGNYGMMSIVLLKAEGKRRKRKLKWKRNIRQRKEKPNIRLWIISRLGLSGFFSARWKVARTFFLARHLLRGWLHLVSPRVAPFSAQFSNLCPHAFAMLSRACDAERREERRRERGGEGRRDKKQSVKRALKRAKTLRELIHSYPPSSCVEWSNFGRVGRFSPVSIIRLGTDLTPGTCCANWLSRTPMGPLWLASNSNLNFKRIVEKFKFNLDKNLNLVLVRGLEFENF